MDKQVAALTAVLYPAVTFPAQKKKKNLAIVVHVLVTSRLYYCYSLYMGLALRSGWKLQLVQNTAAMKWTRMIYRDTIHSV